ncbi:MAG TPA: hypothetical protein VN845_08525 [Solirubrobacteraceae bacterium]|nr:hypothetical protein [Solirubrobacteraceae bacterium]
MRRKTEVKSRVAHAAPAAGIIVLKFGSSVLRTVHDLPNAVHEIYRWVREGQRVIAVVSAIGDKTEQLIQASQIMTGTPEPYATAELLSTGERTCAALLAIALDRAGVPARVVTPREIGFEVSGPPLDGEPTGLDVALLGGLLHSAPVLILPGFFGTDRSGRTHCLGRGGSDLTAAFLAVSLYARCRLIKDVDGVYESDPADPTSHPRRFRTLNYETALEVAGQLIQPKAVAFLEKHRASCEVAALTSRSHSLVGPGPTEISASEAARLAPKEIVILGLGTVGFGVYQRLIANPDRFRVRGILVRDRKKHEALIVPRELLHTSLQTLSNLKPDLVIDALPGLSPSFELIAHYLSAGIDVVTANKAVLAEDGAELMRFAHHSKAELRYAATVGGAAPMLEACTRHAREIASLAGVLNGTCNFVLETCAAGATLRESIVEAERLGFAESNPSEDLSGRDAARKLQILARRAFGAEVPLSFQELDEKVAGSARAVTAFGERLRQVARATREGGRVVASVGFERIRPDSPLFDVPGEWNALSLTLGSGDVLTVRGRGAGRWPTTEALIADVFDLVRIRQTSRD